MNGYLVLGRCSMDDIPMALFDGEKTARDFASTVTVEMVRDAAGSVFGLDATQAISVAIVPFVGGRPRPIIDLNIVLD